MDNGTIFLEETITADRVASRPISVLEELRENRHGSSVELSADDQFTVALSDQHQIKKVTAV